MSDMVYTYIKAAETMSETMVGDLFRGKGAVITFEFRLDHTCYDKNGNDKGTMIRWKVKYVLREGRSYIKVLWTPYSYRENIENWQEIADHDSCWRDCWGDILDYGREELLKKHTAKGNESWFFNCERICMEDKE